MSPALEQAGGAAGLDESTVEIEGPAACEAQPASVRRCENCGATLAGPYCSGCGQRHHEQPVHHFWHFIGEATEDLTHADSRLWQTLTALLFRPGFLTSEFLAGRRVRYLPPVRLYLVVSVIFFLLAGLHAQLSRPQAAVFSVNGQSFHYRYGSAAKVPGLAAVTHTPARVAGGVATGLREAPGHTRAATEHNCEKVGTYVEQQGGWFARFGPRVARSCLATTTQGGEQRLRQSFERNLERAMFLLLPLLALVMKPLYLKPPRHYVEHLLFFLHNHAFLFVVLGLSTLLQMLTSSSWVLDPIDTALTIYVAAYFYRAMRRVYGQDRWLTLGKLTALGVAYFFLSMLMFAVTFSYTFLML